MTASYTKLTQDFKTIADFLRFGFSSANREPLFYGHGTDNAWDDMLALVLGSLCLSVDVESVLLQARLTEDEKKRLSQQLERRIKERVPVPYLTNVAYFCGLSFYVDERVLIPRSPIGEWITKQFSPWIHHDKVTRVLDLGTGSGCMAVACCYAFPHAMVDASDISSDALQIAAINRDKHALQGRLNFIKSDCFDEIPTARYDIIVSNPPYVGYAEMQTLPEEYQHEPKLALEADDHGLIIVDKILVSAHEYLSEHGILVVEVGHSEEALMKAHPKVPFTWLELEQGGHGVFLLTKHELKTYFGHE